MNIGKQFSFGELVRVNGVEGKIVGLSKDTITIENSIGGRLHFDKSPIRIDRLDEDGNVVNVGSDALSNDN